MKSAPILAGATLALLLATLATAKPSTPDVKIVYLDASGIDTLVVSSNGGVEVSIDAKSTAQMRYPDYTKSRVTTRRDGRRLLIEGELEGSDTLSMAMPPSVRRFEINGGKVTAIQPIAQAEVVSAGSVRWEGDVGKLVFRGLVKPRPRNEPKDHCTCESSPSFSVENAKVAELRAYSPRGDLTLHKPDTIGVVYAWMGSKGKVSVFSAQRLDHIHLMADGAQAPAAAAAEGGGADR